ncbi:MAG: hypothetical protein GF401_11595 [Chitinivibrionales bacterium]|nr:hypothetical protein [Chitinivibrionales bacterium]
MGLRTRRSGILHIGRYGEILSVLIKYGFGDIVASLNIERYLSLTKKIIFTHEEKERSRKVSRWERVRLALGELGPTFIKLGQFLSNRPDLIPVDLITELEKLQDSVAPVSFKEIKKIIEQELKNPIDKIFKTISEKPLASASIAQVHRAVLNNDDMVAVKVQRPNIRQAIATDLDILYHLATLLERNNQIMRALHLTQLVDEFERMLSKELDFSIEAAHIERFRCDFLKEEQIFVHKLYMDFSTRKVLTTEFVHGIKVSRVDKLEEAGISPKETAKTCVNLILRQIFYHGFFHADPHPGNILVRRDGSICFLDFGAMGVLPPSLRYHLSIVLYGVVKKDPQRIVRTLVQLTSERVRNIEQLEYDITEFIEEYSLLMLKEIDIGDILHRFAGIITEHNLKIVPGFYLLLRTIIITEGVARRLDPEFNITRQLEPYVKKLIKENPRLRHLSYDIFFTLSDIASLAKDFPFELKEIVRLIKSGDLNIQFEHRGLEPMLIRHGQLVNRLIFAIVLAALIVGSSIVIHSGIPPKFFDIPLIGIAGFLLAAFIGFGLIFSIIRGKKM